MRREGGRHSCVTGTKLITNATIKNITMIEKKWGDEHGEHSTVAIQLNEDAHSQLNANAQSMSRLGGRAFGGRAKAIKRTHKRDETNKHGLILSA